MTPMTKPSKGVRLLTIGTTTALPITRPAAKLRPVRSVFVTLEFVIVSGSVGKRCAHAPNVKLSDSLNACAV